MILYAIVSDFESARRAVDAGATVVQLRLKGASTEELVAAGGAFGVLDATFGVNDNLEATLALGAGRCPSRPGRRRRGARARVRPPAPRLRRKPPRGGDRRVPGRRLSRCRRDLGDAVAGGPAGARARRAARDLHVRRRGGDRGRGHRRLERGVHPCRCRGRRRHPGRRRSGAAVDAAL